MKLKKYLYILLGMGFSLSTLASNAAPAATAGEGGTRVWGALRLQCGRRVDPVGRVATNSHGVRELSGWVGGCKQLVC